MAESFSREKLRQAPQKEGGWKNPVLPSSCVTPAGTSIEVQNEWEENTHTHGLCTYNLYNSILYLHCLMVYYIVSGLFLLFFWCPCMASNVSVQYNGGFLPDIILLTQCYYHRGTRLNALKRFCIFSY